MKKYFVCSDIHSFYDEWMSALKEKEFNIDNPEHIIIICGDLFDRGPKTLECLDLILKLLDQNRAICIKGNHEDLLKEIFSRGYFRSHDYSNGTAKTCLALSGLSENSPEETVIDIAKDNKDIWKYLDSTVDYYELGDYIFVHGWIPCYFQEIFGEYYDFSCNPNWKNANGREWYSARWINGMQAWSKDVKEPGKTIVCGHWHTSWGHTHLHGDGLEFLDDGIEDNAVQGIYENFNTFKDKGIIALDACTAYSGKVNCEVIEIED